MTVRFSIFTAATPEWEPAEAARQIAAAGADGVEWRVTDQDESGPPSFWRNNRATFPLTGLAERADEIAAVSRAAGLAISGLAGYARYDNEAGVAAILAAAAATGAGRARVTMAHTPSLDGPTYPELFGAARTALARWADHAAALGVQVLIELHHGTITASASAARRLVDGLDPAAIGVIHDTGNLVFEGFEQPASIVGILGPYLAHVHVKDARWVRRDDGSFAAEMCAFGTGQVDFTAHAAALASVGYDGWVTLEDFSTDEPLTGRMRSGLAFIKGIFAT